MKVEGLVDPWGEMLSPTWDDWEPSAAVQGFLQILHCIATLLQAWIEQHPSFIKLCVHAGCHEVFHELLHPQQPLVWLPGTYNDVSYGSCAHLSRQFRQQCHNAMSCR